MSYCELGLTREGNVRTLSCLQWLYLPQDQSLLPLLRFPCLLLLPQTRGPRVLVPSFHSTPSLQPISLALCHLVVKTKLMVQLCRHLVRPHQLGHVSLISLHILPFSLLVTSPGGDLDAASFSQSEMAAYNEVLHWRKNFFPVPYGSVGKRFVSDMSRLYRAYAAASSLEGVTLAAACIMPTLLLQNPSSTSKTVVHREYLERRLHSWEKGDVNALVKEGRSIQHHLKPRPTSRKVETSLANRFAKLMFKGNTAGATPLGVFYTCMSNWTPLQGVLPQCWML